MTLAYGTSGRPHLAAIHGQIGHRWEESGIANNPAVIQNADGRLEAFAVGNDNGLWHKWQTAPGSDTWTDWTSLGGTGIIDNIVINSECRWKARGVCSW